jgi:hypothetical protein
VEHQDSTSPVIVNTPVLDPAISRERFAALASGAVLAELLASVLRSRSAFGYLRLDQLSEEALCVSLSARQVSNESQSWGKSDYRQSSY